MENGGEIGDVDAHEYGFLWALVVVGCLAIVCAALVGVSIMSVGALAGGIVAMGFLLFGALLITVDFEPAVRVWVAVGLAGLIALASVVHYVGMLSHRQLRLGSVADRNVIIGEVIFGMVALVCVVQTWRRRSTSMVLITLIIAFCWLVTYAFPWRGELP